MRHIICEPIYQFALPIGTNVPREPCSLSESFSKLPHLFTRFEIVNSSAAGNILPSPLFIFYLSENECA